MRRIVFACAVALMCATTAVAWGATGRRSPVAHHRAKSRHVRHHHHRRHSGPVGPDAVAGGTAAAADPVLLGDQQVETTVDHNAAGSAEAFPFSAVLTGQAQTISVYVDAHNRATKLIAGLYLDSDGHPGARLAVGTVSGPRAGAWNAVAITSTAVASGQTYWVAVLGRGGALYFRDRAAGPCTSESSAQTSLKSLPSSWTGGGQWATCPASTYVGGAASPTGTSGTSTGGTGGTVSGGDPSPPPAAPAIVTAPQVSGTATEGDTLSVSQGTWSGSPTGYGYAWEDCDQTGAGCTVIAGASATTYALVAGDVGHTIRAIVTATNAGGSTSQASDPTAEVAASGGTGGGTAPENCLGVTGSGVVSYASLDSCGYPSPDTTGVPSGTALRSVSSVNCSNTTISGISTSGQVTLGNNCTITDSRLTGGQITVQSGISGVVLSHDEISGPYTGTPADPTCTYSGSDGNTSDILWEGAASGLTLDHDYLHCAAEPFNGEGTVKDSYIISDECWGPCGSGSTTHNEAIYVPGGDNGGTVIEHDTVLNPWDQTAGIFGDDHAWGPIHNLTIDDNLVADAGDNGAIATGDAGDGNTNVTITGNRLSYVYSSTMPTGGSSAASWSGNYRDDTLAPVPVSG